MYKEGSVRVPLFNSSIVMEEMNKTTEDLRMSGKPGHVEYDRMTGNGLTASWMATWTDRQTRQLAKLLGIHYKLALKMHFE